VRVPLDQWQQLPDLPGVYFFYGAGDRLLYVGKSIRLRQRVRSYLRAGGGHSTQTERLKFEAQTVQVKTTGSELAALLLENRLIKEHLPPFNRAQRRWRHYPFLRLDLSDPFPRLEVTRNLTEDGAEYYGPYRDRPYLLGMVKQLSVLLGLRTCAGLEAIQQGCLLDQMDRCSAPCRGWISSDDYRARLEQVRNLLTGAAVPDLFAQLAARMDQAAAQEHYEQAARWRDQMGTLQHFVDHQRWRKHQVVLDACVIQPSAKPGECQVFWIQGGRLAESQTYTAPPHRHTLARYQTPSPPMYRLPQHQLDEFHLIATWLYRNQQAPEVIWLQEPNAEARIGERIEMALKMPPSRP